MKTFLILFILFSIVIAFTGCAQLAAGQVVYEKKEDGWHVKYFIATFQDGAHQSNVDKVQKCATPLGKEVSEIEKFEIDVKTVMEGYPPMISSSQSALFCDYFDTYKIDGDTTPVVLELKYQYIEDGRINERNHVNVENIGRCGVTFKALVDL